MGKKRMGKKKGNKRSCKLAAAERNGFWATKRRTTATSRYTDTLYKDNLNVRTQRLGPNHCILTATGLLSTFYIMTIFLVPNAIVICRHYCIRDIPLLQEEVKFARQHTQFQIWIPAMACCWHSVEAMQKSITLRQM